METKKNHTITAGITLGFDKVEVSLILSGEGGVVCNHMSPAAARLLANQMLDSATRAEEAEAKKMIPR